MTSLPPFWPALQDELDGLADAPRWWVGISGGLDSMLLLALLQQFRLQRPHAPPMTALHVHHGLQAQADEWTAFCEQYCQGAGIEFQCHRAAVDRQPASIEAAARRARYEVFEQCLGQGEILFLAHHLDDQVETFFLRLMRGSGPGLAGMPRQRPVGRGALQRPLLDQPRSELQSAAEALGLSWCEDPSNTDEALDRNYLRHTVLPLLAQRWPGYRDTTARAAALLGEQQQLLSTWMPPLTERHNRFGERGIELADLREAGEAAAWQLRAFLLSANVRMPPRSRVDELMRQIESEAANASLVWADGCLSLYDGALWLLPTASAYALQDRPIRTGEPLHLPGVGEVCLEADPELQAVNPNEGELRMAFRRGGERFQPDGSHCRQSLKKLLQAWRVPPWWRDRVPLLFVGETLLAVGDAALPACENTRRSRAPNSPWRLVWRPLSD